MKKLITKRDFLKATGLTLFGGLGALVLSSCKNKDESIEESVDVKEDNNDIPKEREITMFKGDSYIEKWGPCVTDDKGNPQYIGFRGIKDGHYRLVSDANMPMIVFIGLNDGVKVVKELNLKPYPIDHKYPVGDNQIDFLGKMYQVTHLDPDKITLKKINK